MLNQFLEDLLLNLAVAAVLLPQAVRQQFANSLPDDGVRHQPLLRQFKRSFHNPAFRRRTSRAQAWEF